MFDKIKPLNDRVLVELVAGEDTTPAGIIIPDAAKEKTQTGKVLAVGQGRTMADGRVMPLAVKAGDMVFFGKYSGVEAGEKHLMLREDDILGIVQKV